MSILATTEPPTARDKKELGASPESVSACFKEGAGVDATSGVSERMVQRILYALGITLLTVVLSFGIFFMDGNVGVNLADEGYLWYGVSAIKAGQVPVRDFQAYDPGRYYWVAACSYVFGDSLVAMRAGCVLFQCIGIVCALLVMRRVRNDWGFLFLVAVTLVLWMTPQYKLFEQAVGLIAVYVGVRLIERPTLRQHFFSGIAIGLMGFMGRNHGVYLIAAFGLMMLLLARGAGSQLPQRALACGLGTVIGYLPQWLMLIFVPGYFHAFVTSDLTGGAGLPLPVPWPWRIPAELSGFVRGCLLAQGAFFVALAAFIVVALVWMWALSREEMSRHPVFAAAACVTIFYAHHCFSRPEWVHLAHSIPMLVVGLIAMCETFGPKLQRCLPVTVLLVLFGASIPARALHMGLVQEAIYPGGTFVPVQVRGQNMYVSRYAAAILGVAERVTTQLAKPDEPVVFLPHWPGLYAVTGRLSPLKQIYFMLPMSIEEEEATIASLKETRVKWVILQDYRLDGRDELRFRNTNPDTYEYFLSHFARIDMPGVPRDTVVLRLKE